MKKNICLVGSFMCNANYGDVIQAKVWIDWYKINGYKIKFICYKHGKNTCLNELRLQKKEIIDTDEFLSKNFFKNGYEYLHLYGGGYLNELWCNDFIDLIKKANNIGMSVIATGVQVDKIYANKVKNTPIKYLSVRDELSKRLVGNKRTLIVDDSFIYFNNKYIYYKIIRKLNCFSNRNNILLQLSLNSYVYKKDQKTEIESTYKLIIQKLQKNNILTISSSFPPEMTEILEAKNLINYLGIDGKNITYSTTTAIDKWSYKKRFKLAIVNSFHTYIELVNRFSCPVYFLALNEYYKQKAKGLMSYGLLDNDHLITDLKDLIQIIDSGAIGKSINSKQLDKINNKSKKVIKRIMKIFK